MRCNGVLYNQLLNKEKLWDKYYMDAPKKTEAIRRTLFGIVNPVINAVCSRSGLPGSGGLAQYVHFHLKGRASILPT